MPWGEGYHSGVTIRDPEASPIPSPVVASVDAALVATLATAKTTQPLDTIAHTDALAQPAGSGWLDDVQADAPGAILRDLAGVPLTDEGEIRLDLGAPSATGILPASLHAELARDADMDGVYLDGVGSGRGEPSYDPHEDPAAREHVPHGGDYGRQGTRAMAAQAKAEVMGEGGAGHIVATATHEGLASVIDLAEESVDGLWPVICELLEVGRDGTDSIEPVARHSSPPLVQIAHGERAMAGRIVMPFNHAARDTSLWHPGLNGKTGLTRDELNQLLAVQLAACVVSGTVPILSAPADFTAWQMQSGDSEPVLPMLGQAFDAFADERWTANYVRGLVQPPLVMDTSDWGDDFGDDFGGSRPKAVNPFALVKRIAKGIVNRIGPPGLPRWTAGGDFGDDFGDDFDTSPTTPETGIAAMHLAFDVPQVLAGVFRARGSTDLCLVLANWTNADANWGGWFVPRNYGWQAGQFSDDWGDDWAKGQRFRIDRLVGGRSDWGNDFGDDFGNQTETTMEMATRLSGPVLLDCSGVQATRSAGGAVLLGPVPAYKIQAYRIRQE